MAKNIVSVERYVEQVLDGRHYKGYIKIGDAKLDYEVVFVVPIDRLNNLEQFNEVEEIRRIFQITVKRDIANIELTVNEYRFFFTMIVELAVEFYGNKQTRASQEGVVGQMLRGKMPPYGVSASIGMTTNGSYNFTPELCDMLSSPKFGCAFVAV